MKKLIFTILFVLGCFVILLDSKTTYSKEGPVPSDRNIYYILIHDRENINNIINLDKDFFLSKYMDYFKNNKNVPIIFNEALKKSFPVNLAMSLAFCESSLNEKKWNENTNDSIDRGLFQLNSKSYEFLSKTEMYDPEINTKYGIAHIQELYFKNNSYFSALAEYNCGSIKRINPTTFKHVSNILNKEIELNEMLVKTYEEFEWSTKLKNGYTSKVLQAGK